MALKVQLFDKNKQVLYPQANINNIVNDEGNKVAVALSSDLTAKADLTGTNTFSGINTFSGTVTVPDVVVSDSDTKVAVNRGYVDGAAGALGGRIDTLSGRVDDIVEAGVSYDVVTKLPAVEDAAKGIIYLVPDENAATDNIYQEYMLFEKDGVSKFQVIGTTATDLSTKADKSQVEAAIATAASDATTKAGTAKAEAIAAAASDAAERVKAITDQLGELGAVVYYEVVSE